MSLVIASVAIVTCEPKAPIEARRLRLLADRDRIVESVPSIDFGDLPARFTLAADVPGAGTVSMLLDNGPEWTERQAPFVYGGDDGGAVGKSCPALSPGKHTLRISAWKSSTPKMPTASTPGDAPDAYEKVTFNLVKQPAAAPPVPPGTVPVASHPPAVTPTPAPATTPPPIRHKVTPTAMKQFADAWRAAKTGDCELEPGVAYDFGASPFQAIDASSIRIATAIKSPNDPPALLTFNPTGAVRQALTLGGKCQIADLMFAGNHLGQLLLANKGNVSAARIWIYSGAGFATMGGASMLDVQDLDAQESQANLIYVGAGQRNGILKLRDITLRGGMVNEHGLRTHALVELDWDGGLIDGSGSVQGKDVLTIHELIDKGTIANVRFRGWATIGGLTPASGGDQSRVQVNNLTLKNCTFEPCVRAFPNQTATKPNGARIYVLAGVNNFLWDGGTIESIDDQSLIQWTNTAGTADRKPPTGEIRNVHGKGPGKLLGGDALKGLKWASRGCMFNAQSV